MQESGCGTVRFPAEVGVMVHDQGDSGKCRSEKFRAGAAAVTQLLASTCVVLTARAEPAASTEGAQGAQGAQVDLRVLYRLLRLRASLPAHPPTCPSPPSPSPPPP